MSTLENKVIVITGATKGFGRSLALKAAKSGAKVVLVSKVVHQNASNTDTIFTMAEKINALGSEALAIQTDIRYDDQVHRAVEQTLAQFGQIDICINAASVNPTNNENQLDMIAFDLFHQINIRSTMLFANSAKKALQESDNPHILCVSPDYQDVMKHGVNHLGYGFTKSALSYLVTLLSKTFALEGIAVNALWPKGPIDQFEQEFFAYQEPNEEPMSIELMADAALQLVQQPSRQFTGKICLDRDILMDTGVTSFDQYFPEQIVEVDE